MSTLGWVHLVFALVALFTGTAVVALRKGTRWHRMIGNFYVSSMLGTNISAFFIYDLFGGFGPFHWMAIGSLLSLVLGMVPVITRRPKGRWLAIHGGFITGSYVGLVAALVAEVSSRSPQTGEFVAEVAALSTVIVLAAGIYLIGRYLPQSMGRTPRRFH